MKTLHIPNPPTPGTVARLALGCKCAHTGLEGAYLFSGEHHSTSRCSPVYPSLIQLFPAVRALGWVDEKRQGGPYTYSP